MPEQNFDKAATTLRPELLLMISVAMAALATLFILTLDPLLRQIDLLPDQGASWYYWKRPDPDMLSRLTAWGGYFLNQLFFWGIIYWATHNRASLKDRRKMHPVNYVALGGIAVFALLHYLQTALWYDGLAQDTSVFSSQGSVIVLLVFVLAMEAPRRGLLWGRGGKSFTGMRATLIKYHGYYFAWAVVYTFWFHPMETTPGHLVGFFYMFLLMLQGAFIFTRVHTNRYWTFLLEGTVAVHAVIVAVSGGQSIWPMFLFGFLAIMVVTQIHGLGLSRVWKNLIAFAFVVGVVAVYWQRGFGHIEEVFRIPVIDYLLVALIWAGFWVMAKVKPPVI